VRRQVDIASWAIAFMCSDAIFWRRPSANSLPLDHEGSGRHSRRLAR
jgi:hypothetical protein